MALFVPNPDAESVEEIIEQLSVELARMYRDAEDELIREIAKRAARDMQLASKLPTAIAPGGLTVAERRRQNRILAELAAHRAVAVRELQSLAVATQERLRLSGMVQQIIELAAREGEAAAAAQLGFASRVPAAVIPLPFLGGAAATSATTLTSAGSQAVAMVALSLQNRLDVLNQRITRFPQDAYQRIIALHSPNTLLGITTSRTQQAAAVQRFLAEGIPAFVDRSGRRWTIGAYAEMAGRTSVNRAYNDAGVWRMQQSGVNLVTVVRGLDSCKKCAAWAGKILSTDGTPAGPVTLPHATNDSSVTVQVAATVDGARNAGWGHPNCRCRLVPYLPGLTVPQDDTTYDPEAEKERAEQRRLEREIRAAKRLEATALNDTDRARAAAGVREAQAQMREFVRDTGRQRRSYREQLHFSDGRGGPIRATPAPKPPAPRTSVDIRIKKNTDLGAAVYGARASIARVHTIPTGLRHLPVETARLAPGVNGVYRGGASRLQMSMNGPSPRLTFAHEIGHYLDHQLLGTTTRNFESRLMTENVTRDWLAKVTETASYRALAALKADPLTPADIVKHIDYLMSPVELWGRSYAQYIATRSADKVMLAELAAFRASESPWIVSRQWSTTDFEPVASAIDEIFRGKGLLK
ncbi:hypothetical protein GCM10009775_04600 [Microbacterium aoyamense]|uniref:Phage minor capsid protein 2 n=1 Tax=Microbacterium aoyamense TaxID=344166 RepID=A0ABP5AL59_9MICO|nr:phage minor capsid protein [Microbacterium aoyamense]